MTNMCSNVLKTGVCKTFIPTTNSKLSIPSLRRSNKKAVLSQGEPGDVAVNFDTYRILQ